MKLFEELKVIKQKNNCKSFINNITKFESQKLFQ